MRWPSSTKDGGATEFDRIEANELGQPSDVRIQRSRRVTHSKHLHCYRGPRQPSTMSFDRTRRLSLDLFVADLRDRDALVALVASHAVAPARALCGMERPRPDEPEFLGGRLSFGALDFRPAWPEPSPASAEVAAFLRGFLLMAKLFPGAVDSHFVHENVLRLPGSGVYERAFPLACLRWPDLEVLVDGILGGGPGHPGTPAVLARYRPEPGVLDELEAAQRLIRAALGAPEDFAARVDIGLQTMDQRVAFDLDEILRRDCHMRLVWLSDTEMSFDADDPDPLEVVPLTVDRGVFTMTIPESLTGLVVLDFVETLRTDPQTGRCAQCGSPLVVTPQQAARQRKGDPIYHDDCRAEHRLCYVREYQRSRRRRERTGDAHTFSGLEL
jgi:hypothetical protein